MLYPAAIKPGNRIAITAFSSGVPKACHARLDIVLNDLSKRGFHVVEGQCLRDNQLHVSASTELRVAELMAFLLDDSVDVIMAPWGGEVAMELLPLLDWLQLEKARPKWLLGFSDISTVLSAISSKLGWATCHCTNLMQLALNQTDDLTANVFTHLATSIGSEFKQIAATHYEPQHADYSKHPNAAFNLTEPSCWKVLNTSCIDASDLEFSGRLVGGCLDTHMVLYGTDYFAPYNRLINQFEPTIYYFENGELTPTQYFRALQSLKLKGAFKYAAGILIGRNIAAEGKRGEGYDDLMALKQALGDLEIPILYDVDISHQAPNLTLINGAMAKVKLINGMGEITQKLI
ncbi:LD-carboxypeptidase [Pseudoalteromonas luteoviolacea]|uniref:S66 family peptidase n=1 Tax=Pseudoalteromonas luteoviolacea TaxID=43657 RepID=UPI001F1B0330|nr:S66 peptidase family protein [Pseudoalteromonas luteoviolacea]MCF6440501.1 LD-carboxypeptidase [Pseudoalteromonas luteoviolacea]